MENGENTKIYSAGYAASRIGVNNSAIEETALFFEKEPEGAVGASNLFVMAEGVPGTWHPEVTSRFCAKKVLYEYFKSHDYVDANKLAIAIRNTSNELFEYAKVQEEEAAVYLTAVAVTEGTLVVGSVGNCSVFIVRSGKVYQITDSEKAEEQSDNGKEVIRAIGREADAVIDVYDGIEVKPDDIILILSHGMLSYVGKREILEAIEGENSKVITESLLSYAEKVQNKSDVSAAVIKIYDEEHVQTVVRNDTELPIDTDINQEMQDINLKQKSKPRTRSAARQENKTGDNLPLFIIGALLVLLLAAAAIWGSKSGLLPSLMGEKKAAIPEVEEFSPTEETIDIVQASLEPIHETAAAILDTDETSIDQLTTDSTAVTIEDEPKTEDSADGSSESPQTTEGSETSADGQDVQAAETTDITDETTAGTEESSSELISSIEVTETAPASSSADDSQAYQYSGTEIPVTIDEPIFLTPEAEIPAISSDSESEPLIAKIDDSEPMDEEEIALANEYEESIAAEEEKSNITSEDVATLSTISEIDGAEMAYVPGGNFTLGADISVDLNASYEETPQVEVYLDSFYIDKTEVTNGMYQKCVDAGVCYASPYMSLNDPTLAEYPINYVTYDNAATYCKWAGKRLPTEFEWEKAAKGVDGNYYPWGEEEPSQENRLANFPYFIDEESTQGPGLFRVRSLPDGASIYGAFDMAGNVWEWTSTFYNGSYYQTLSDQAEADGTAVENPQGPESGMVRTIRGGSASESEVNGYKIYMRSTNRGYVNMSSSYYIGFRCVMPETN